MSRTDKDDPYWVKVNDHTRVREERHNHTGWVIFCHTGEDEIVSIHRDWRTGARNEYRYTRHAGYRGVIGEEICDLAPHKPGGWKNNRSHCDWRLSDREVFWHSAPPKWYRDHVWHNPERVRVRDQLREAVKEWNANGDTDVDVEDRQARRSAWCMWT